LKTSALILFFSIVTLVYLLVNYYIYSRAVQAFTAGSQARIWFSVAFWLVASTFIVARIMERAYPCCFTGIITWIGSFWLAFLLYFVLIVLVIDISRLLNHLFHFFPDLFYTDYGKTKLLLLFSSIALVTIVVVVGFINARTPVITRLNIHINKSVQGEKELNIVMASDIHMGTIIAKRKVNRLVDMINGLKPDLILFAGDIVDEDLAPVINKNLGASLCKLKSRYGTYAITGNHEYIGGAEKAVEYLTAHCVHMLRDSAVFIDNRFYLAGRDDRDKPRFSGRNRKSLEEVMAQVDPAFPVILMDHQPFSLGKTAESGVDLSLSGHTHHGQLWPFNYITSAIYELSRGYKQIGKTHFFVSTGFGTWGPPIRLGNRPEIVFIHITFN
jgi:uncharacterized protein